VLRIAFFVLAVMMLFLSESRAGLLTFALAFMAAYGVFHGLRKSVLIIGAASGLAVIIWPMLPQYDIGDISFLGKIQNAFNEIAFETGEDRSNIYANWRGFEAYRAYETWRGASFAEQIFGLGFGARIDLGQFIAYGDDEVESLQFVHNAYFTLLVKTGIVGILAMVYFLMLPFRIPVDRQDPNAMVLSQIARGASIALLVTMALIAGPLNKQSLDGLVLLWAWSSGALIRMNRQARTRQTQAWQNPSTVSDQIASGRGPLPAGRLESGE
jgi:O-antigen ligase